MLNNLFINTVFAVELTKFMMVNSFLKHDFTLLSKSQSFNFSSKSIKQSESDLVKMFFSDSFQFDNKCIIVHVQFNVSLVFINGNTKFVCGKCLNKQKSSSGYM